MQSNRVTAAAANGKEAAYFGVPGKMPAGAHRRSRLVTRSMSPTNLATTRRGT